MSRRIRIAFGTPTAEDWLWRPSPFRVCANPACKKRLTGRGNKKTCSDTCRTAASKARRAGLSQRTEKVTPS